MRTLLPVLSLLALLGCAFGQEINRQDPAAVARAYLDACEKWDTEAASKLALDDAEAQRLRDLVTAPGPAVVEQALGECLCLPITRHARYVLGEVAATGNEVRVQAVATYSAPLTLVLRKGEDGNWRVAVRESILSTTGATETMVFTVQQMASQPGQSDQAACLSNLKQLVLAILQYAQDYDEVLPPADKWRDAILPYMRNVQIFQCSKNPWGYTYNATLSKKPLAEIAQPAETIILFEVGHAEANMAADPAKVQWAHRHNGGDCVGYVDGHVKWLPGQ